MSSNVEQYASRRYHRQRYFSIYYHGFAPHPLNRDRLICRPLPGEDGDRKVRSHPGIVDGEVAQGNCREAADLIEDPAGMLSGKHRDIV